MENIIGDGHSLHSIIISTNQTLCSFILSKVVEISNECNCDLAKWSRYMLGKKKTIDNTIKTYHMPHSVCASNMEHWGPNRKKKTSTHMKISSDPLESKKSSYGVGHTHKTLTNPKILYTCVRAYILGISRKPSMHLSAWFLFSFISQRKTHFLALVFLCWILCFLQWWFYRFVNAWLFADSKYLQFLHMPSL